MNRRITIILVFVVTVIALTTIVGLWPKRVPEEVKRFTKEVEVLTPKIKQIQTISVEPSYVPVQEQAVISSTQVPIPTSLHVALGVDESKDFSARIKAIHALSRNLSDDEIRALYNFLNLKQHESDLPAGQLNALKNDIVNTLELQNSKPRDLVQHLMAMYVDQGHDDVWRDYCIQHLSSFYSDISKESEKREVRDLFWKATDETDKTIAGTALLALTYNSDQPDFDKDKISGRALAMFEDKKCRRMVKTTALQICARLGDKRVLPIAREIATSSARVPLRMSAIAAVGTLGDESDRVMLEKYATSGDVRLSKSAQSALKRLIP